MVKLIPQDAATFILRSAVVPATDVRARPRAGDALPQAIRGEPEYLADPRDFVRFVQRTLDVDPGRTLASLERYASDLAAANDKPADNQRGLDTQLQSPPRARSVGGERLAPEVARERLAVFKAEVTTLVFRSGLLSFNVLSPRDVSNIYGAARAANIPLGAIVCLEDGTLEKPMRLLTELVPPQQVGFTGGNVGVSGLDQFNSASTVINYVKGTTRAGQSLDLKISRRLQEFVRDKFIAASLPNFGREQVESLLQAFASGDRGSAVAAFRQLALTTPDIVPRLQRVLRNYQDKEIDYQAETPTLQKATRILSLLFGADMGLRKVQLAAMTTDLVGKSDRLRALMLDRPTEAVWDLGVVGVGAHGRALIDRVARTNPETRVLGMDRAPASYNFGRSGGAFFMNSRQGVDDGKPGGNGRGNINPVAGAFLVSDASGTAYPVARDVDDVGVMALHEAGERSALDVSLDADVMKIEHRRTTRDPSAARWPAGFRITYADGRVAYSHRCAVANGFGNTPKPFGSGESDTRFQQAIVRDRNNIASWRRSLAEAIVDGNARRPSFNAYVMTTADALAVSDTDGADVLSPFRANVPAKLNENQDVASCTFIGFGDSTRTALELALRLAPDDVYRNTPAQLGQLNNLVWVVGDGPTNCFEFLVGRDYLKRILSDGGYQALMNVLKDKPIEELFANDGHMKEIREKLAPADQDALDGARTRYQRISGAILKGILRLEPSLAASFDSAEGGRVEVTLENGRKLVSGKLIDGRGYQAELGPIAWLTDPDAPDPKKKLSDAGNLTLIRAPVPEGVIGRDSSGNAVVAKSVAGLEDVFAWVGPGNGGDLVSKKLIESTTKVGANTVSLFVNQPLTLAATDRLAAGASIVGQSITELYPEDAPVLAKADAPTRIARRIGYETFQPVEVRADSRLEMHARLASLLQGFDVSAFEPGQEIGFAIRRAGGNSIRGMALEISSETIGKESLQFLADKIIRDGRFSGLVLQTLQDTDVALAISGNIRETRRGRELDVPKSELVYKDAEDLSGNPVAPDDVLPRNRFPDRPRLVPTPGLQDRIRNLEKALQGRGPTLGGVTAALFGGATAALGATYVPFTSIDASGSIGSRAFDKVFVDDRRELTAEDFLGGSLNTPSPATNPDGVNAPSPGASATKAITDDLLAAAIRNIR